LSPGQAVHLWLRQREFLPRRSSEQRKPKRHEYTSRESYHGYRSHKNRNELSCVARILARSLDVVQDIICMMFMCPGYQEMEREVRHSLERKPVSLLRSTSLVRVYTELLRSGLNERECINCIRCIKCIRYIRRNKIVRR
jgi:hypothetical protein